MDENRGFLREYFGVLFDKQTYLNLVYLLTALPLGVFYFVLLMTGLSLGFSLAIVLVGIPILFAMAGAMQALGRLERALNHVLLDGGRVPDGIDHARASLRNLSIPGVVDYVRSGQVVKGGVYLFGKFVFGIAAFSLAATVVGLIAGFLIAPINALLMNEGLVFVFGMGEFTGFPAALVALIFGIFGAPFGLRFLNGLARLWGDFGASMLDEPAPGRYRYVRVEDDEYDDPFAEVARKNDQKPKNNDIYTEDNPFYDDDLHIARVARERSAQDDAS